MFTQMLFIATLITGFLWCLNKFFYSKKEQYKKIQIIDFNKINKKNLKKIDQKQKYIEYVTSTFPLLLITLLIRSFICEPFQIPSGSMMPTLLKGDFILVEKFIYGIKDPFCQKTLIKFSHPKRGDVVVFRYPGNPRLNYIKRIIGLPGDKITYNFLTKEINIRFNCNFSNICNNTLPVIYSDIKPSNFVQNFTYNNNGKVLDNFSFLKSKYYNNGNSIRLMERKETIGNVTHRILILPIVYDQIDIYYHQQNQPIATWIVPSGTYLMMGDNRDNSADSRYWGFVPEANLIGKAIAIWMNLEKKENKWLFSLRFDRIGWIY